MIRKVMVVVMTVLLIVSFASCAPKDALVDDRLLEFNRDISDKTKLSLNDGVQILDKTEEKGDFSVTVVQALTVKNGIGIVGKVTVPEEIYSEAVKNDDFILFTDRNMKIDGKDFNPAGIWEGGRSEWIDEGENTVSFVITFHGEKASFTKGDILTLEFTEINSRFAEFEDDLPVTISWELENVLSDIMYERSEG